MIEKIKPRLIIKYICTKFLWHCALKQGARDKRAIKFASRSYNTILYTYGIIITSPITLPLLRMRAWGNNIESNFSPAVYSGSCWDLTIFCMSWCSSMYSIYKPYVVAMVNLTHVHTSYFDNRLNGWMLSLQKTSWISHHNFDKHNT